MSEDLRVIIDADAEPLRRELASAGASVRTFGRVVTGSSSGQRAFSAAVDKQKESLRGLGTVAKYTAFGIGATFAVAIGHAILVGASFEKQMARVQAVTGATGKEMDQLRQLAIKLGAQTKFSAGEAAEAMYELASAGFDTKETAKALPGTLALAAASSVELADAAEISSNALRGFGLRSSESTHVADVLAKAVNSSSAEMVDLQQSLKYIGPVARATGESFETMIGAVSVMADAGIKGEQAGTSLRGGLLRLVKPTKQVEEGLHMLGVEAGELQGPHGLLPLPQLVGKLQEGMQGLSKSQQAAALDSIFGKNALSGMLSVVDAGPQKLRTLTGEFEHSAGASAKAAHTMNDTVAGAFDQLKGSFETVEIELFTHFQKPLHDALMNATGFVNEEGKKLQDALAEAMATPEFKNGDFEKRFDLLAEAAGKVWNESGLSEKISEGLVAAFNFALPRMAEAAGKGSVTVAKAFIDGFFQSDALGRLVISTWLFSKLGGFAALKAAGLRAGAAVNTGVVQGIESGAAAQAAGSELLIANSSGAVVDRRKIGQSVATTVEQGVVTAPTSRVKDALGRYMTKAFKGLAIADIGLVLGPLISESISKGLGSAVEGAGAGAGIGFAFGGPVGAAIGAAIGAGVKEALNSEIKTSGAEAAEGFAKQFDEQLGPAMRHAVKQKELGKLVDLRGRLEQKLHFSIAIDRLGPYDPGLKPLRDQIKRITDEIGQITPSRRTFERGMDELETGLITRMADIRKVMKINLSAVDEGWVQGSAGWRRATAEGLEAAVGAIRTGMRKGVIEADKGKQQINRLLREIQLVKGEDPIGLAEGFSKSWRKAEAINQQMIAAELHDLGKMPQKNREIAADSMIEMARAMEAKGQLVKGSADKLRSALVTKFGRTNHELVQGVGNAVSGIAGLFDGLAGAVGKALEGMNVNVKGALKAYGVNKDVSFAVHTTDAAVNAVKGLLGGAFGRQQGGIVSGHGDGDKVPFVGQVGAYVLNREATGGFGFRAGGGVPLMLEPGERYFTPEEVAKHGRGRLEWMNQAIPRQEGGNVGLKRPVISGPEPLASLGQGAVDPVYKAAAAYIEKHMPHGGIGAIAQALFSHGLNKIGTAGVLGNSWRESHDDPSAVGTGGGGLFGFTAGAISLAALQAAAGRAGVPWTDIDFQVGFMMRHGGASLVPRLNAAKSPEEAAVLFMNEWERPGIPAQGERESAARKAFRMGYRAGGSVVPMQRPAAATASASAGNGPASAQSVVAWAQHHLGNSDKWGYPGEWCGAFLGADMLAHGIQPPSGYPLASSWGAWGKPGNAGFGDVVVIGGSGHVGLSLGGGRMISGNFSDTVAESTIAEAAGGRPITGYREPPYTSSGSSSSVPAGKTEAEKKRAEGKARKANYEHRLEALRQDVADAHTDPAKASKLWKLIRYWGRVGIFDKGEHAHIIDAVQKAAAQTRPGAAVDVLSHLAAYAHKHGEVTGQNPSNYQDLTKAIERAEGRGQKQRKNTLARRAAKRTRKAAKIAGYGEFRDLAAHLADKMGAYEGADQLAERLVALEPEDLNDDYVGQERGAWGTTLTRLGGWRNVVVEAIAQAEFREREWEGQIGEIEAWNVPGIPQFEKRYRKERWKLKPLHEAVASAKSFLSDRHSDMLGFQGVGGPQGVISGLGEDSPYWLTLGGPGASIFDTQLTIRDLGLKTTGGGGGGETALTAAEKALAEQALTRAAIAEGETRVYGQFLQELGPGLPYIGAYQQGSGGKRVGQTGWAVLHRDEMVTPDPKGPAGSQLPAAPAAAAAPEITLVLRDRAGDLVELIDARVDGKVAKVDRQLGTQARRIRVAPGR